jgi:hypothetical protein
MHSLIRATISAATLGLTALIVSPAVNAATPVMHPNGLMGDLIKTNVVDVDSRGGGPGWGWRRGWGGGWGGPGWGWRGGWGHPGWRGGWGWRRGWVGPGWGWGPGWGYAPAYYGGYYGGYPCGYGYPYGYGYGCGYPYGYGAPIVNFSVGGLGWGW